MVERCIKKREILSKYAISIMHNCELDLNELSEKEDNLYLREDLDYFKNYFKYKTNVPNNEKILKDKENFILKCINSNAAVWQINKIKNCDQYFSLESIFRVYKSLDKKYGHLFRDYIIGRRINEIY